MLGGLCELDPLDIRDSELLIKKLFQKHQMGSENVSELGAGIGRVSQHLFRKHFQKVFRLQNKVGCVLPTVIWSEFRIDQYREDDHRDAPNFITFLFESNDFC